MYKGYKVVEEIIHDYEHSETALVVQASCGCQACEVEVQSGHPYCNTSPVEFKNDNNVFPRLENNSWFWEYVGDNSDLVVDRWLTMQTARLEKSLIEVEKVSRAIRKLLPELAEMPANVIRAYHGTGYLALVVDSLDDLKAVRRYFSGRLRPSDRHRSQSDRFPEQINLWFNYTFTNDNLDNLELVVNVELVK